MRFIKSHGPLLRAVAVLSAVGVLVTGVTFAALQSQTATLTGNSIQSATALLQVGVTSATSTAFDASKAGFKFDGIVPGGPAMPVEGESFWLKNAGTAKLSLKLVVGGTPVNATGNADPAKVKLILTRVDSGVEQAVTLKQLTETGLALTDPLAPKVTGSTANVGEYSLRVAMEADAFTDTAAVINGIDLIFSGTALTN